MEDKIMLIIFIVVIAAIIIAAVIFLIKILKMKPEERTKLLKTYLKGAIAWAEQEFAGSGRGAEKIEAVEKYFKEHASWLLKIVLKLSGKENLRELIEEGLKELKENFEK